MHVANIGYTMLLSTTGPELARALQIVAVRKALENIPEETKGNVEKKQARTYEELQAEQAEQDQV